MSAGRICTRETHTATPAESIRHGAIRMQTHDVGTLVVVDEDDRAVGMLTDRDIALRCVGERLDADETAIGDIMSVPVCSIEEDTPIETALGTMATAGVRRAVVTNTYGKVVGILALDDVLELLVEEAESVGVLLRAQTSA